MLVPASERKSELTRLFSEVVGTEDFFFFSGNAEDSRLPDFDGGEGWSSWAIVDDERVIGYFDYFVDSVIDSASCFGVFSFDRGNPVIGFSVGRKMEELVATHHRVEWRVVGGNPVQKHYDRFCERHGGRKLILRDATCTPQGKAADLIIYEIIKRRDAT